MEFDSKDEEIFSWWLEEARKANLIVGWERWDPKSSIEILPLVTKTVIKQLKTKTKCIERVLLRNLSYTPDFQLLVESDSMFHKKLFPEGKFTGKYITVIIDVKSSVGNAYGNNQTAVTFPIIQKVLYHLTGIYVYKVTLKKLFKETWCPYRAYWMKGRILPTKTKLGEKSLTIQEYLKEKVK